jgi:hypothetical protein
LGYEVVKPADMPSEWQDEHSKKLLDVKKRNASKGRAREELKKKKMLVNKHGKAKQGKVDAEPQVRRERTEREVLLSITEAERDRQVLLICCYMFILLYHRQVIVIFPVIC